MVELGRRSCWHIGRQSRSGSGSCSGCNVVVVAMVGGGKGVVQWNDEGAVVLSLQVRVV